MKQQDVICISSDEEDNVPLCKITNCTSYNSLISHSIEQCEFCDRCFNNKYQSLIHNSRHIIIPLLKQDLVKCMECLHVFTSQHELDMHILKKHPHNLESSELKIKSESVFDNQYTDDVFNGFDDNETVLKDTYVLRNETVLKDENVLRNETVYQNETVLKNEYVFNDETVFNSMKNDISSVEMKEDIMFVEENQNEALSDTINRNGILNDLLTECKVDLGLFEHPFYDGSFESNKFVFGNKKVKEETVKVEDIYDSVQEMDVVMDAISKRIEPPPDIKYESIHYDQLMVPGIYRCSRCVKMFPNRYELIIHDTTHMKNNRLRKGIFCPYCDTHLCGNHYTLKKHIRLKHPLEEYPKLTTTFCRVCGLRYKLLRRHLSKYHKYITNTEYEAMEDKPETNKLENTDNAEMEKVVKIIKSMAKKEKIDKLTEKNDKTDNLDRSLKQVCEVCYAFLKNCDKFYATIPIRTISHPTKRVCHRCNTWAYDMTLVKRVSKNKFPSLKNTKLSDKLQFQEGKEKKKMRETLTNENRLKNIQKRFKLMNTLSRF